VRDGIIFDIETATIIAENLEEADIGVNLVQSRMSVFHCLTGCQTVVQVFILGQLSLSLPTVSIFYFFEIDVAEMLLDVRKVYIKYLSLR
jgi:hypothetical protein